MLRRASCCLTLLLSFAALLTAACSDLECPEGLQKDGKLCRRPDASADVADGDSGHQSASGSADVGDAASNATRDGSTDATLTDAGAPEASRAEEAGSMTPATDSSVPDATDSATPNVGDSSIDSGDSAPAPECSSSHPCGGGYLCEDQRCISPCMRTNCDANATCSLVADKPVCSCNGGYFAIKAADGSITCQRDVKCEELGCDPKNGECLGDTAQTRRCACKNGFTGDGKTCTPVSCPMPSLANGTVSTPDGVTFGKVATFLCNSGHDFATKATSITRTCGADKTWGPAVPACEARDCGTITIPFAAVDTSRGTRYGNPPVTVVCQQNFVRTGPRTVECQADGKWSTRPSCLGCGDKVVSNIPGVIQEECDPTAPNWNYWNCMGCSRNTLYLECLTGTCSTSNNEWCYLGVCTRNCNSDADCVQAPNVSTATAGCSPPTGGICIVSKCATKADCPPNQGCSKGGATPFCMPCEGENCF